MTRSVTIVPTRGWFRSGTDVELDVVATGPEADHPWRGYDVVVRHLGDEVDRRRPDPDGTVRLGRLAPGGYGIELCTPDDEVAARTAVDVRADGARRMRYGFVASYQAGRDPDGLARLARELHLTHVQFYDWGYRHADLLGGGDGYTDPLGRSVSLRTVRALIDAVNDVGVAALGYAAVYAVGNDEWDDWRHLGLESAAGSPYALADFLRLVDPAAGEWREHLISDLARATALGFDGFHLDQYGYPKWARRADGPIVDVADSFARLIEAVRAALPDAVLVFNNVNDFPTRRTVDTPQDAVYIEPWEPNTTLGSLGDLITRAGSGHELPIVLAAYQSVYTAIDDIHAADRATELTMATIWSHGATQLLAGEDGHILVDPYYVRNRRTDPSTADLLRRWYDFLVEHDELLAHDLVADVTASTGWRYNDDLVVSSDSVTVSDGPIAGTVWQRNTCVRSEPRYVVHLINLAAQRDTLWDAPREPHRVVSGLTLRIRAVAGCEPRVRVADPDGSGRLEEVPVVAEGSHATARLPPLRAWQLVLVDLLGAT